MIEQGSQVEIKNTSYGFPSSTIKKGIITLRKIESKNNIKRNTKEIIGSGIVGGFGIATISATSDQLFVDSFE